MVISMGFNQQKWWCSWDLANKHWWIPWFNHVQSARMGRVSMKGWWWWWNWPTNLAVLTNKPMSFIVGIYIYIIYNLTSNMRWVCPEMRSAVFFYPIYDSMFWAKWYDSKRWIWGSSRFKRSLSLVRWYGSNSGYGDVIRWVDETAGGRGIHSP
jgi:hypothetical protein